ncbi:MAG: hypothetical protein VXW80_00205, partial [Candidatus Thermoplasmatota archaeon]|nr:hypothetical protein [Candidatus Thermoplasmatota archaeon]
MSDSDHSTESKDTSESGEMVGYRQQPGKLPFSKPGSGGKNRFSKPTDYSMIPKSQGGSLEQP